MSYNFEILKDPIHGYIEVYPHELEIIDKPPFQRLRRIYQDTAVHFVYPGATHTRFSHSLGVMHIAGLFTESLLGNISQISEKTKMHFFFLMRLWGLTHDIGHGPFSHLFDDIILSQFSTDHEKIGGRILQESRHLPRKVTPPTGKEIDLIDIGKLSEVKNVEDWPLTGRIGGSGISQKIFYYITRGAYSADIMDYLLRDSYFTGAGYGNVDWRRLIYASKPIGDKIVLNPRAEDAFDSLLLARLFMFSTVYYHRTTRAAVRVIEQFLKEANSKICFKNYLDDIDKYLELDEQFLIFHPLLQSSQSRLRLLNRDIPYSRVKEIPLRLDERTTSMIEGDNLTLITKNKLPNEIQAKLPEESFFVDTPKIASNPLTGERFIYIENPDDPSNPYTRDILDLRWGTISKEFAIVRLYIHDNYREYENDIVQAFPYKVAEGRSHY